MSLRGVKVGQSFLRNEAGVLTDSFPSLGFLFGPFSNGQKKLHTSDLGCRIAVICNCITPAPNGCKPSVHRVSALLPVVPDQAGTVVYSWHSIARSSRTVLVYDALVYSPRGVCDPQAPPSGRVDTHRFQ